MNSVESLRFTLESPDLLRAHASARHFDLHMHDTFSVVVLRKGSASLQSRRWSNSVHAGDAFVFNPFEVHMGGTPQDPVEYEVLYPSWRFVSDCCPPTDRKSALPIVRTDVLRRCDATEALMDALSVRTDGAASVETALRKFMQSCSFEPDGIAANGMTAVQAACQLIDERYMFPIHTDTLASHVGLHRSHFVRTFHRVTGIAPQTYVRQVRIAKAREAICTGAALSDAAQLAGFCDQAHLTREFRKVYGVTPGRLMRDVRATRHQGRRYGA